MKKRYIAAFCLLAAAASVGLTSCSDVDLDKFYLDSLPESIFTETSEADVSAPDSSTEDGEEVSSEAVETTVPAEQPEDSTDGGAVNTEAPAPDTDGSGEVFELSEAEQQGSTMTAEPLGEGEEPTAEPVADDKTIGGAYASVIAEYADQCDRDPLMKPEFCRYYIADMDGSGTPELLAETGSCEADRTVYVYSYDSLSAMAKEEGSFVAWHAELGMSNGRLGCETKTMGSYLLTIVELTSDGVKSDRAGVPTAETTLEEVLPHYAFTDDSGLAGL